MRRKWISRLFSDGGFDGRTMKVTLVDAVTLTLIVAICSSTVKGQSCQSIIGGEVYPQEAIRRGTHNLVWSKAQSKRIFQRFFFSFSIFSKKKESSNIFGWSYWIVFIYLIVLVFVCLFVVSKPAPDFKAQAIVNGEIKEVKLSDYKGKYVVFFFYPLDLWVYVRWFCSRKMMTDEKYF